MRKGQAVVRTYRVSEIGTYFSLPFSNFTARGNKKTTKKRARGQSYNVNTLTYINTFFFSFQTLQKKREGSEKEQKIPETNPLIFLKRKAENFVF